MKKGRQEETRKMTTGPDSEIANSLSKCFSNSNMLQVHPGSCTHTDLDLAGLDLGKGKLRFCISNQFPSDSDADDLWNILIRSNSLHLKFFDFNYPDITMSVALSE